MCYSGQHLMAQGIILSDLYCLSLLLFKFTVGWGPCILDHCIALDIFKCAGNGLLQHAMQIEVTWIQMCKTRPQFPLLTLSVNTGNNRILCGVSCCIVLLKKRM
jgi:hypothetical protein